MLTDLTTFVNFSKLGNMTLYLGTKGVVDQQYSTLYIKIYIWIWPEIKNI